MKHAYLTQTEITKSLRDGAITTSEADELMGQMERCNKFAGDVNEHFVIQQESAHIYHALK